MKLPVFSSNLNSGVPGGILMLKKSEKINHLFDLAYLEVGKREVDIFKEVYADEDIALEKLFRFLMDVRTCPKKVVIHCQKMLATHSIKSPN